VGIIAASTAMSCAIRRMTVEMEVMRKKSTAKNLLLNRALLKNSSVIMGTASHCIMYVIIMMTVETTSMSWAAILEQAEHVLKISVNITVPT